jgi:hypothetical protein
MSEVRWNCFGEIATQNGCTFLYSGYNAVEGPVLSKIAKRSFIQWHPISEGILTAPFKGNV